MKARTDWPSWLGLALQGLTFWIGHRRCLYKDYPLSEGAFVAELCNLIRANIPDRYKLACEVQYSQLIHRDDRPTQLTERARADLVVYEKVRNGTEVSLLPRYIIEVKRATAPKNQIDADISRLVEVRAVLPDVKTYLIVVAEAKRPKRFVSSGGVSITTKQQLDGGAGYYKVRRTFKAAHAYTKVEKSQYACLIETFANR